MRSRLNDDSEFPRVDFSLVPETEKRLMAAAIIKSAKRYYSDPAHMAAFEEWQRKRHEEKEADYGYTSAV